MAEESLSLDERGQGFVLRRVDDKGRSSEITLSEANVLTLAESAERMRDSVLARYRRTGSEHPPVSVLLVDHVELNLDALSTSLQLTLVCPNGWRSPCFALPSLVARSLYQSLPEYLSKLEAPKGVGN